MQSQPLPTEARRRGSRGRNRMGYLPVEQERREQTQDQRIQLIRNMRNALETELASLQRMVEEEKKKLTTEQREKMNRLGAEIETSIAPMMQSESQMQALFLQGNLRLEDFLSLLRYPPVLPANLTPDQRNFLQPIIRIACKPEHREAVQVIQGIVQRLAVRIQGFAQNLQQRFNQL